MLIIWDEHTIS